MAARRLREFLRKRRRAFALGLVLRRSSRFELPDHVRIAGRRRRVSFPGERGVRVAFGEILFADTYGVEEPLGAVETVLDVGANVGIFTLAARNAFPNAAIHAYEPNAALEPYLRVQAEAADACYFIEAVALEDGSVALDVHEDSVQTRTHADPEGGVRAVSLATAVDRLGGRVDFLKLDCEGAEWELVRAPAPWRACRHVALEYHLDDARTHEDMPRILETLGFTVRRHTRGPGFGVILASA